MNFLIHNPKLNLRARLDSDVASEIKAARMQAAVGVIPIVGALSQNGGGWFSCGSTYSGIAAALEKFEADETVEKIILDIDSPGGEVAGVFELADRIRAAKKPVVAYTRSIAASAAYLLFSSAQYRVAHYGAWLGSVGAYEAHFTGGGVVKYFVSAQSPQKIPDPESKEGAAAIQRRVDTIAQLFIDKLAEFFSVTSEKIVENFGGGEIVLGQSAVSQGMADAVGNFRAALAWAPKTENEKPLDTTPLVVQPQAESKNALKLQIGAVRRKGAKMAKTKMAFVVTDDSNVTEGSEVFEVTKDLIREKFPEIFDSIQKEALDEAAKDAEEVEAVAETADEENPEEKDAVAQARAGKMSADTLARALLSAKAKYAASDAGKRRALMAARNADQPAVANSITSARDFFHTPAQKPNPFARFVAVK